MVITKSFQAARRSTRIRAEVPLHLTSLDPASPLSEYCQTLVVNTQGCGVRLSRALDPGTGVRLDELPGGGSATARVANCVPLGTDGKYWLVGLALDQQGNIWGIQSPPADWGTAPPKAVTPAAASTPAKKTGWPYSQFSSKGEFHPGRK